MITIRGPLDPYLWMLNNVRSLSRNRNLLRLRGGVLPLWRVARRDRTIAEALRDGSAALTEVREKDADMWVRIDWLKTHVQGTYRFTARRFALWNRWRQDLD